MHPIFIVGGTAAILAGALGVIFKSRVGDWFDSAADRFLPNALARLVKPSSEGLSMRERVLIGSCLFILFGTFYFWIGWIVS
ncbi:hypothetical protein GCM10010413_10140 [Promicromonospora sukumoe]